jgi:hypothetical protein
MVFEATKKLSISLFALGGTVVPSQFKFASSLKLITSFHSSRRFAGEFRTWSTSKMTGGSRLAHACYSAAI